MKRIKKIVSVCEEYIMGVFRGAYSLIIAKICLCREKLFRTCEVNLLFFGASRA